MRRKFPSTRSIPGRTLRRFWSVVLSAIVLGVVAAVIQAQYSVSLQAPVRIHWQWPVVFTPKITHDPVSRRLTAYQQYACNKFGEACRVALAVQRAENPRGACEVYHYNSDGTLDWGYFQINTVHLKRAGVNLRDLLDCKANIDFAYKLYMERGFAPWSTFNSGAYREFVGKF